jgi:hypothetical protein
MAGAWGLWWTVVLRVWPSAKRIYSLNSTAVGPVRAV